MSRLDDEIEELVRNFVDELSDLVRASVTESIIAAATGQALPKPRERASRSTAPVQKSTKRTAGPKTGKKAAKKTTKRRGTKRVRRSAEDIEKLEKKILAALKSGPMRPEELAGAVGLAAKELHVPLKRLAATKKVKSKGSTRAKEYRAA